MDYTNIFHDIIGAYGITGLIIVIILILCIVVLPVALPIFMNYTFNKNTKSIQDSLTDNLQTFANTLSNNLANQNNTLIASLQKSQDKLLDNQSKMISYMFTKKDNVHSMGLSKRQDMLSKVNEMLKRLLIGSNANRVSVIEFHNSKENLNGLPFLWYDIHAEFFHRGTHAISNKVKNLQINNLIWLINQIDKSDENYFVLDKEQLEGLWNESPVLYDHLVNELKATLMIYVGLYNRHNEIIGLLAFEFINENVNVNEIITESNKKITFQTARQIETLLELYPIDSK